MRSQTYRIPGRAYERPLVGEASRGRLRLHTSDQLVAYVSASELSESLDGCPAASSMSPDQAHRLVAGVGQRLLVSLRHRLLFCPIEKNAMTSWTRWFFDLHGKPCRDGKDLFTSLRWAVDQQELPMLQALDELDAARAIECLSWKRAVVVRDPLERLLSAFIDKCVKGRQRRRHCPNFRRKPPASFRAFVDRLTPEDVAAGDYHFRQQAQFCGLSSSGDAGQGAPSKKLLQSLRMVHGKKAQWKPWTGPAQLPRYTHVLRLSESSFEQQVLGMARQLHIDSATLRRLMPNVSRKHVWHRTGAAKQQLRWYTRATAERALALYKMDYDLFGLPRPSLDAFNATIEPTFVAQWSQY